MAPAWRDRITSPTNIISVCRQPKFTEPERYKLQWQLWKDNRRLIINILLFIFKQKDILSYFCLCSEKLLNCTRICNWINRICKVKMRTVTYIISGKNRRRSLWEIFEINSPSDYKNQREHIFSKWEILWIFSINVWNS